MTENFWNEETIIKSLVLMIREYVKEHKWSIEELNTIFEFYMEQSDSYKKKEADYLISECLEYIQKAELGEDYYFIMTFVLHATKSREIYRMILSHCIKDCNLQKESKFYLYYQFVRFNFLNPEIVEWKIENLMDDLYSCIYQEYREEVTESYEIIQKEERNCNVVIVFTSQVLGIEHGPTKTLLDRCRILEEILNKKVLIINTAECMTNYGAINFFRSQSANYISEYLEGEYLVYENKRYAFLQCENRMPQVSIIRQILEVIKEEKPYFILTIGGNSILSDICSNVIPTLTISLAPSDRAMTRGQFQAIGRKVTENDLGWMKKHNYSREHIIESLFTSAFKMQTHKYKREQLGLPSNGFVVVLIGGRLDWEIDEECMKILLKLIESRIYVAFMGNFKKYEDIAKNNKLFDDYTINLGFQEDVLAVNECCDLYMNPKRMGGGTSVAEALYKGLPVVTMNFGDGAVGAGEDFFVADYDEMYHQVLRYASDKEFYSVMSNKAKERAKCLMDSETEFVKIVERIEHSENF